MVEREANDAELVPRWVLLAMVDDVSVGSVGGWRCEDDEKRSVRHSLQPDLSSHYVSTCKI